MHTSLEPRFEYDFDESRRRTIESMLMQLPERLQSAIANRAGKRKLNSASRPSSEDKNEG